MANLVRLCARVDLLAPKPLIISWKSCAHSVAIQATKHRFSNNWLHFITRKVISNSKEPLSLCKKVTLGITAGIIVKVVGNNSVFCFGKSKTRLNGADLEISKNEPKFNWKKFFLLLQPYWLELLGAIIAALACAMLNILIPKALGHIVDVLTKISSSDTVFDDLKKPALHVIGFYTIQSFFTFVYIALLSHVGEGVSKTMKLNLFSSVLNQDIAFFDRNRTGEILNRLTVDIQDFKSSLKMIISQGLRNVTQIIGCTISLFYISPSMTGLMMVVVPSLIIIGTFIGSYLRQISFDAKSQAAKVTLIAEEAISNIRTVRAFAMEELEKKIVDEEATIAKNLNIKLGYGIALFQAGTNLFLNGMVLSTIYLGGYMMSSGQISAGDLMAFLVAVQMLQRSFSQISLLFGVYIRGKHAGARVFEMIDLPEGQTLGGRKTIPHHTLIPNIEFKDVHFSYPTRPNRDVLKKINLNIPEGKTVAIVGSSGSGKSTLAWLLERFYDTDEGAILINGVDVRALNSKWLRRNVIGFISQEPTLFATTVMENIRYGKPNATDAEVIEAAKLANADKFIREFPDGYQTVVGERGISISGGQKQRIAIARALIKNPYILILDEATSALDAESEKAVQTALDEVTKSRTTMVIAHRLSTIKNADLIVVLHNGVIVETGTHKELLAKGGMYAALVAQQLTTEENQS